MENQQLIEYIKAEMAKGIPLDVIRVNLKMGGGWNESDIAGAMQVIQQTLSVNRNPAQNNPVVTPSNIPVTPPVQEVPVSTAQSTIPVQNLEKNTVAPSASNVFSSEAVNGMGSSKKKLMLIVAVSLIGFAGIVGIVYGLMSKTGFMVNGQYSESNFFTNILDQSTKINSSKYKLETSLKVEPRDSDAKPFDIKISNEAQVRERYQNDSTRMTDVGLLMQVLSVSKTYPATLQGAIDAYNLKYSNSYYKQKISSIDPETKKQYEYSQTDGGNNFELKITFTTSDALNTIRRAWGYAATTTPIEGKTVTFTKDSTRYAYFPAEPPEPLLVSLGKQASYLPADFAFDVGFTAMADWKSENADWNINLSGSGDFGDLTYKVSVDVLKKAEDYYLKINNIPSLFLLDLSNLKGQWIRISAKEKDKKQEQSYDMVSSLASQVPEFEKSYKESREETLKLVKKAAQFADEEKLVEFKGKPKSETLNEMKVTRYDLTLRKESILPFYKKLYAEVNNGEYKDIQYMFNDSGFLEYLQSDEFNQVYEYFNSNTSISITVDAQGFPVEIQNTFRLIPPDTATQFKNKQLKLTSTVYITDINSPVKITAPSDAKDVQDIVSGIEKNNSIATGDLTIKSSFSNIRAQAELYYDKQKSYGTLSANGKCTVKNTVFTDSLVSSYIASVEKTYASAVSKVSATCYNTKTAWAMSMPLINPKGTDGFWCADSTGYNGTAPKKISKASCQ